jgi:hypothetical protein
VLSPRINFGNSMLSCYEFVLNGLLNI